MVANVNNGCWCNWRLIWLSWLNSDFGTLQEITLHHQTVQATVQTPRTLTIMLFQCRVLTSKLLAD